MSDTRTSTPTTPAPRLHPRRLAGAALLAGALTLTGCSSGGQEGSASSPSAATASVTAAGEADIEFAQGMLPHHEQAVEMAQLAEGRAADPRVLELAKQIEAAQAPEIDTLTGWLEQWGAEAGDHGGMGGTGHGEMSEDDTDSLAAASGPEFDRLFLQQMIEHHTGAVAMAETEIIDGQDPGAVAMAEEIARTQQAEIDTMEQLLTELGS